MPAWEDKQASFEQAMNEHSLLQKKKKLKMAGASTKEISEASLKGVNPSQAGGMTPNLDKTTAALGAAQQMGALPSEGAGGGMLSGAMAGAQWGAPGAAIGAVAGAIMGSASARAAKKAHNRQVEANKHAQLGQIAEQEGQNIANILSSMGSRMKIY